MIFVPGIYVKQIQMYCRSGTGCCCCICAGHVLSVLLPDGSTFLCKVMSWLPSWTCDIISNIGQSIDAYSLWRTIQPNFMLYNKLNTFSNLKLVSWHFDVIWRLLQNWKWVDSSLRSVISVEMSWFTEKSRLSFSSEEGVRWRRNVS